MAARIAITTVLLVAAGVAWFTGAALQQLIWISISDHVVALDNAGVLNLSAFEAMSGSHDRLTLAQDLTIGPVHLVRAVANTVSVLLAASGLVSFVLFRLRKPKAPPQGHVEV